jgi:hypothetical protein
MLRKIFNFIVYGFALIGAILILGFVISKTDLTKNGGRIEQKSDYFTQSRNLTEQETYTWLNTEEYLALQAGLRGEKIVLNRVEKETGIKGRLLASILFVEQMRLFTSDRELFKKVFEPLKILGVQSQFSWGILGLKQETLIQIEKNLRDTASPFYLGPDFETALDFRTTKPDEERFERVTDTRDHYYAYLYAALFLKQIENQWQKAGFDIAGRPEILATLYNIGFIHSIPKADPQAGGAEIEIAGTKYSFGRLAYEFYYSDELTEEYGR